MSEHTFRPFDDDMHRLRATVLDLGVRATTAFHTSVDVILAADSESAAALTEQDRVLNDLQVEVGRQVLSLLTRQQPVAQDLRSVIAAEHMGIDLERVGDHAKSIARAGSHLEAAPGNEVEASLRWLRSRIDAMLRDAMRAYGDLDADLARRVRCSDRESDSLYQQLSATLLRLMREGGAISTEDGARLLLAAKSMERVGDHAANLAADTLFIVTGSSLQRS